MLYVNTLAEIVHQRVDEFAGAANKNIGEAFLLVWKFDPLEYEVLQNGDLQLLKTYQVMCRCDMSILSFVKIIADLAMSYEINQYNIN